jgi:hypothetical protein
MIHVWTNLAKVTADLKPANKFFNAPANCQSYVTCGTWLKTQQNQFITGYNDGIIALFDYL